MRANGSPEPTFEKLALEENAQPRARGRIPRAGETRDRSACGPAAGAYWFGTQILETRGFDPVRVPQVSSIVTEEPR